jgi:hypothetical protein
MRSNFQEDIDVRRLIKYTKRPIRGLWAKDHLFKRLVPFPLELRDLQKG